MAQLTRLNILNAAVGLVDDGPSALTMRALGDKLGVTSAALYYWYPGKSELLDAVAGHLAEQIIAVPHPEARWDDRLRSIANGVIRVSEEYPRAFAWVFTTYAKRPPLTQIDEALLDVLMSRGLDPLESMLAKGAFWRFILGHLGLMSLPSHIDPATVDRETHPRIHEVAEASAGLTPHDYFEYGLDLLVASLVDPPAR